MWESRQGYFGGWEGRTANLGLQDPKQPNYLLNEGNSTRPKSASYQALASNKSWCFTVPRVQRGFLVTFFSWKTWNTTRPPDCSSNLCPPKIFAIWLFWGGGVLGLVPVVFLINRRPKTPPEKSYSKCFRRTQSRWVIWWSSNNSGSQFMVRWYSNICSCCSSASWLWQDFREGDEDSNFSVFRVRRFTESPGPLHWIAFPVEILIQDPSFTELPPPFSLKTPFFSHWKVLRRIATNSRGLLGDNKRHENTLFGTFWTHVLRGLRWPKVA